MPTQPPESDKSNAEYLAEQMVDAMATVLPSQLLWKALNYKARDRWTAVAQKLIDDHTIVVLPHNYKHGLDWRNPESVKQAAARMMQAAIEEQDRTAREMDEILDHESDEKEESD